MRITGLTKPLTGDDKLRIERELRRVLAMLPPDARLTTKEILAAICADDWRLAVDHVVRLGKPPYNLAERGEPEPVSSWLATRMKKPDATKRPLIWRRIASPDMPVTKAEPSKLTLGEAMTSLAPSYAGRREPGTFGAASDVRSLSERLADVERRVCDLEEAALCKGVRL